MHNLDTIMSAAISCANLDIADQLAAVAKQKRELMEEQYKNDPVVMAHLGTIITIALGRGNMELVDNIAEEIKTKPPQRKKQHLPAEIPVV